MMMMREDEVVTATLRKKGVCSSLLGGQGALIQRGGLSDGGTINLLPGKPGARQRALLREEMSAGRKAVPVMEEAMRKTGPGRGALQRGGRRKGKSLTGLVLIEEKMTEILTGKEGQTIVEGGGRKDQGNEQLTPEGRSRSRSRERERRGVDDRGSDRRRDRRDDERREERSDRDSGRGKPLERSSNREHRRHGERSSRRERSPSRGRDAARQAAVKAKAKDDVIDYAEVIRGYENMSAAEKLKARTKYALSQTVRKDSAKGLTTEWERFDFDAAAPLDEDARQDMYGDDTKAGDDAAHLLNTGSTFGIAKAQAVREAEKQAAHDAAIFGLPVDRSGDSAPGTKMPEKAPVFVPGDSEEDEEDRPVIVEEEPQARAQQPETEAEVPVRAAVPSWKERALRAQQARKQAAGTTDAAAPG